MCIRDRGNNNPIQRLGLKIVRKRLSAKLGVSSVPPQIPPANSIQRILDYARWAPSGDNTQPWQFEIFSDERFVIYTRDTRDWCVYDLAGRASQTSAGALLENISIAAQSEGLEAKFTLCDPTVDAEPVIDVQLAALPQPIEKPPLLPYIKVRSVQRLPLSMQPLMEGHKQALEEAVGPGYRLIWIESRQKKWQITRLLLRAASIRLTIPEVYEVHKKIIHWDTQFSPDRIPDQALGADALTVKMMKWALQSWSRVKMLNRYFAGTIMPRVQLDLIPALRCGAHFMIVAETPREKTADYLQGGRATQRFWLTATKLGLQLQPEMTPLIFSTYSREGRLFTGSADKQAAADTLRLELEALSGGQVDAVFMGRLGFGTAASSRSLRKTLQQLQAVKK
ncbi:MAG: nitroreductase family protein [Gammaproteobacteria bacterium]|nr:nitroreductase family protein [Gammaproteobacteria bacterium]